MYSIGLDIGIASVGYSVIESRSGKIVELGARIFEARNSDNNKERREFRGGRRLIRRRKTRLDDAKRYLDDKGFENDKSLINVCPYALRVKGLTEELSKPEIRKVILHILKKRGVSYLSSEDLDTSSVNNKDSFKQAVTKNLRQLDDKTPGQIQYERLKDNGRVKTGINQNGQYQLNVFDVASYANELKIILEIQKQYHQEIDDEFLDFFIKDSYREDAGLIYRKRPYYDGPGNAAQNSTYGRWANYKEDGKPAENIFDQLIGKDFTGKIRASNLGPSAQKFNLLNDLNNLRITTREEEKLTFEEKQEILELLENDRPKTFGPRNIAKMLKVDIEDIKGWRLNNKEKPEIHTMKEYNDMRLILESGGFNIKEIDLNHIEEIASLITLNTEREAFELSLNNEIDDNLKEFLVENFAELRKCRPNNSWHSFSKENLQRLITELEYTSDEQNTILERLGLKFDLRSKYSDRDTLPIQEVLEEIYNPTVSKSVRQTFRVFNALVKKYGKENIDYVTIEMPRDKNEDDQKKTIREIQKVNKNRKDKSKEYFLKKSGWSNEKFEEKLRTSRRFASKLYYFYEQDGLCAYTGQPILPEDLLSERVEVDHIIPLSVSLDDSINNKVLVTSEANQKKGQRSPYDAFMSGDFSNYRTYDEYKAWVLSNKYKKYKQALLLEERNIFDPEIANKFKQRNLNDTRYASRVVLNAVQSFFYRTDTKTRVVNGAFTHTLRKKWNLADKDRETHHHHAIDATLIAVTPFVKTERYEYYVDNEDKASMVDTVTGTIIPYSEYKKQNLYDRSNYLIMFGNESSVNHEKEDKSSEFIQRLIPAKIYPEIKFSHQVDRKSNRKLSDATIYSTRSYIVEKGRGKNKKEVIERDIVGKIKDIYTTNGYDEYKKYKDKLLAKELDPKTFEKLEAITEEFSDTVEVTNQQGKVTQVKKSPFLQYCEKYNVPGVTKYSKKNNGPVIRSLKYRYTKLRSHIDISPKDSKNTVALLTLAPWRTDVYYSQETESYHLLGLKYIDLSFRDGGYGVPKERYEEIKKNERIPEDGEFKFSLYKKDYIEIEFDKEILPGLYQSRDVSARNKFSMKPIDKTQWTSKEDVLMFGNVKASGVFEKTLKKNYVLRKYHIDVLGNKFEVKDEVLNDILE